MRLQSSSSIAPVCLSSQPLRFSRLVSVMCRLLTCCRLSAALSSSSAQSTAAAPGVSHSASSGEPLTYRSCGRENSSEISATAAASASWSPSAVSPQASSRVEGGHAMSEEEQQLLSQWKAALHRCLAALNADPLPSLLNAATRRVQQSHAALNAFLAAAEANANGGADEL